MRRRAYTKAYAAFKQGWHLDMSNKELTEACQLAHQSMIGLTAEPPTAEGPAGNGERDGNGGGVRKPSLMSQEELCRRREAKYHQEQRMRAMKAEAARAAAVENARLSTAEGGVSGVTYREEALRRTVQMARGAKAVVAGGATTVMEGVTATEVVAASPSTEAADATMPSSGVNAPAPPPITPDAACGTAASAVSSGTAPPTSVEAPLPVTAPLPFTAPLPVTPEYSLTRIHATSDGGGEGSVDRSGEVLVISVTLPRVHAMRELALSVAPTQLELTSLDPTLYAPLALQLPDVVDDAAGSAKFDKKARVLTVRLPVAPRAGQLV